MKSGNYTYIWQHKDWPNWVFDSEALAPILAAVHRAQGRTHGRMENLGFALRDQATLQILTEDVLKTSEIEGEKLSPDSVRSSIACKLGLDIGALAPTDRNVDGIVEVVMDASNSYEQRLTQERLFAWHGVLFPTGYSNLVKIRIGTWRNDAKGPTQVVSGAVGRQKVHYEAPPATALSKEMKLFLTWFNAKPVIDPILKAGLAHLWFVTLHPFDDGNGRIARAIGDRALAAAEKSSQRFYSLSAQIQNERKDYYRLLEQTQKGDMDVTAWLSWYLGCLLRAIEGADATISNVLAKSDFWKRWAGTPLNARQINIINRLLDGFEGKLTSSKWASIARCSPDSALRDANDLIARGMMRKSVSGGRSTSYELVGEIDSGLS